MSTYFETGHDLSGDPGDSTEHDEHLVTIRRNIWLHGAVGAPAFVLGFAYVARGSALAVLVGMVLLVLAALNLPALIAPRTPLLVVDEQGIRFRVGMTWRGLPWREVRQVVVEHSGSLLREGRLVVVPRDPADVLDELDQLGRVHLRWNEFWYGAPISLPLGITTLTDVPDLAAELSTLGAGRAEIVVVEPEAEAPADEPAHAQPAQVGFAAASAEDEYDDDFADDFRAELHGDSLAGPGAESGIGPWVVEDDAAYPEVVELPVPEEPDEPGLPAAVLPLRDLQSPARFDVHLSVPAQREPDELTEHLVLPTWDHEAPIEIVSDDELQEPGDDEAEVLLAREAHPVARPEPVIGPKIVHAREMLDMSIDELSQRTRIRPHVLEAIELDDFGPCGGDFYARGHLTAISRVLGLTLDPLMKLYDEHYAQAPINARRVFEAELSTGLSGGMRATLGGPRWSLVIGAVLSLAMIWGLVRIFAGDPASLNAAPDSSSTAGLSANRTPITSQKMRTTTMTVTAAYAATHVVVEDRTGKVLWSGDLVLGKHRRITGLAPFKVSADNAGAVEVSVKGKALGDLGTAGVAGSKSFG